MRIRYRRDFKAGHWTTSMTVIVILLLAVGTTAAAADWTLEPTLRASEIYRSNANLGPSDDEQSSWITELSPGFRSGLKGVNNELQFDYEAQGLIFRGDIDREDLYHLANLNGALQVMEDHVFLDLVGRYDQQNIDPAGRVSLDNTFDGGNRTDVGSISASPYWRQSVGGLADSEVRYTYTHVGYFETDDTTTDVEDSDSNAIEWTLMDAAGARLGWQTYYSYRRIDYDDSPEYEYQRAMAELSYDIGNRTRLIVAGGSESDMSDDPSQGSLDSAFFEGGFLWEPTSLQSLEARIGDRFYGTSWELHYKRRGSRGDLNVDYTEEPTTSAGVLFDDSVFRPDGSTLGVPRQDAGVYLRKRINAGISYEFLRSVIRFSAYREKRDYETSDEDETYWGIRSGMTWEMRPRTQLLLDADWENQDLSDGEDDLGHFSAELRRTLRKNMTLGLQSAYYMRDSDRSFDYDDWSGALRFNATF